MSNKKIYLLCGLLSMPAIYPRNEDENSDTVVINKKKNFNKIVKEGKIGSSAAENSTNNNNNNTYKNLNTNLDALNKLNEDIKRISERKGQEALLSNDNVKEDIFKTLYEIYNLGTDENKSEEEMHTEVAKLYFAQVGAHDKSVLSKFLHKQKREEDHDHNDEKEEKGRSKKKK